MPRHSFVYLLLLCLCTVHAIWPLPAIYSHGSEASWLDPDFVTVCEDERPRVKIWSRLLRAQNQAMEGACRDQRLQTAVKNMHQAMKFNAFVPWKFHPKGASFEPCISSSLPVIRIVRLRVKTLFFSDSEDAYELEVGSNGETLIMVNQALGAVRALATFTQLFYRHSEDNGAIYSPNIPIQIRDWPRFEHRGLNLDISRNIITPKDVMRTLQAMALNKFNRLHLHASDAQSWPLEIPSLPELAEMGAYHPSQIWSVSDLREVQTFGFDRGIEVYLEIDMPGHTAIITEAYPELVTSYNCKPWEKYSAQPPSGQLKLENTNVTAFIRSLLDDLLPRVAPFSSLFHLGGDEISPGAYNKTASEVKPHLQSFVNQAISLVHGHGFTPVVWEEQLLDYNLTLPHDTIIQAWRGSKQGLPSSLAQAVANGHRALFGAHDHWYLDCGHGGYIDPDPNNHESPIKSPFLDYCGPYHNWRDVYSYDPLADVPIKHRHLVMGGEVSMWAEQTDGNNLDSSIWPRLAAAGEILWRGKGTVREDVTRRLAEMREWLVAQGVAAAPVQVTWCLVNPGNCIS